MRALTWQGKCSVSVETVPDLTIEQPTDAAIRVTSTAICGSDLHLYEVLGPVVAMDRTDPRAPSPGNVLESQGSGNALRGGQGNAMLGVARNLRVALRSATGSF